MNDKRISIYIWKNLLQKCEILLTSEHNFYERRRRDDVIGVVFTFLLSRTIDSARYSKYIELRKSSRKVEGEFIS